VSLPDQVPAPLMRERIAELRELQDSITAAKRDDLIDEMIEVLVDEQGVARGHREAPQIDGVVRVPTSLAAGSFAKVRIVDALGPDLVAEGASDAG
jgi:tRNA A37 methylthiotransferase MiaB